jgi:hypothetical protein
MLDEFLASTDYVLTDGGQETYLIFDEGQVSADRWHVKLFNVAVELSMHLNLPKR